MVRENKATTEQIIAAALTTPEVAEKWGITRRQVSKLCQAGRIKGAVLKGKTWLIPADAQRPYDHRHLNKKNASEDSSE